jgi:hypothetical protein
MSPSDDLVNLKDILAIFEKISTVSFLKNNGFT